VRASSSCRLCAKFDVLRPSQSRGIAWRKNSHPPTYQDRHQAYFAICEPQCFIVRNLSFYRSTNSIFGKVGRTASEAVTLQLILTKCVPLHLYGLESCRLPKFQLTSLDFVVNRFLWNYLELVISRLSVNVVVSLGFSCPVFCCPVVLRISCVKSHKLTTIC